MFSSPSILFSNYANKLPKSISFLTSTWNRPEPPVLRNCKIWQWLLKLLCIVELVNCPGSILTLVVSLHLPWSTLSLTDWCSINLTLLETVIFKVHLMTTTQISFSFNKSLKDSYSVSITEISNYSRRQKKQQTIKNEFKWVNRWMKA